MEQELLVGAEVLGMEVLGMDVLGMDGRRARR
jgi:hypothetical protein